MRTTYSDIKKAHFRAIGKAGAFSDPTLIEDFQYSLGTRYQLIWDTLASYINQDTLTATTESGAQYYYYPVGTQSVDSMTITIGSVSYPLSPVYSQEQWDWFNALQFQPTAIPQLFFPRQRDFGIWPIPTDAYTITFQRFYRDRNLLVDDVTSGTVTLTQGSVTVTGTDTAFTEAMIGRWFTVTDTSTPGQGYWYRVADVTSATVLELETYWAGSDATDVNYRIGESPELPEGAHNILAMGTAADFYSGMRNDVENSKRFDNAFWTGSMSNISRNMSDKNISGGLIGVYRKFKDRDREIIVDRQPQTLSASNKIFASSISE